MTAPAEVGTVRGVALELDHRREANTAAILERQADLAALTEEEFERRLAQVKTGQARMARIFETLMVDGVHYGTKQANGKDAFKSPDLTMEGASVLRTAFRLTPERVGEPKLTVREDYCEATVTVQLRDSVGRVVAIRSGSCNSQEGRFYERPRSRGRADQAAPPIGEDEEEELAPPPDAQALKLEKRGKPLYTDAREVLHQCIAMAEKRGAKLATTDATGVTAFLKERTRAAMHKSLQPGAAPPWSQEEKDKVYLAAKRAGITRATTLRTVVMDAIGHEPPTTGEEVLRVLAALAVWTKPAAAKKEGVDPTPVRDGVDALAEGAQPQPAGPVAAVDAPSLRFAVEQGDAAEPGDEALDARLARE